MITVRPKGPTPNARYSLAPIAPPLLGCLHDFLPVFARGLPHGSFIAHCRSRCKPSNMQYGYIALRDVAARDHIMLARCRGIMQWHARTKRGRSMNPVLGQSEMAWSSKSGPKSAFAGIGAQGPPSGRTLP
jgi:hypothetical protein